MNGMDNKSMVTWSAQEITCSVESMILVGVSYRCRATVEKNVERGLGRSL